MPTLGPRTLVGLLALGGLAVLPGGAAPAQEAVRRVTLDEALEAFAENSLALKIARSEAAEARGAARQSGAYFNPSVAFGHDDLANDGERFWEQTVVFAQQLEWPGRTLARRRAVTHATSATSATFRADMVELAFEVREAYVLAWLAEEAETAVGQAAAVIGRVAADAESRLEAGDISGYEARRLRLERARAEQEVAGAALRARAARRHLATLISPGAGAEEVGPAAGPEGVPPPVSREAALEALRGRPDLEAAARELDAAEAVAQAERSSWVPMPTLGVGYRHDLDGFGGASLGFDLPLPLFDRGGGTREEALARSSAVAYRLQLRRRLAEYDLLNAMDRYVASRARVEAAEGLLADSEALLSPATAAYDENEMTLLELLDAAGAFQDARLTVLSLQSEAWIAYFDLLRAMGRGAEEEP
ncbi:MAG: TolC family protein [Gemmatimonadota bacterium]|nr:TolC family protein [Gemmatimonadota bacterium]